MEIKELEKSEITKVVKFYGEVALSAEEKETGKERFESKITNALGKDHMLIALENEEIVGFSWSEISEARDGKKVDKVKMLLISPDKYGVGIGGELMERERVYAKENGVDVLDIEAG